MKYIVKWIGLLIIIGVVLFINIKGTNTNNINKSLTKLRISINNEIKYLGDILKNKNIDYIYFYSDECPFCKAISEEIRKDRSNRYLMIDVDDVLESNKLILVDKDILGIRFVPYVVKIDSNCIIINEISARDFSKLFRK